MNPAYTLVILTTLAMHKSKRDVTLKLERYVDFIPQAGMTLRFTNEAEDTFEVELENVVYDYSGRKWEASHEDHALLNDIRDSDGPECTIHPTQLNEYIDFYKSFGWEKVA